MVDDHALARPMHAKQTDVAGHFELRQEGSPEIDLSCSCGVTARESGVGH